MVKEEKRVFPRVNVTFPIKITPDFIGQTVNLSEGGFSIVLNQPLQSSVAHATIDFIEKESIEAEFEVIWNKHLSEEDKYNYGICFTEWSSKRIGILREIVIKNEIENIIQRISDESVQNAMSSFFTQEVKEFIGFLNNLQKNAILWDLEKQSIVDSYSHRVVAQGNSILDKVSDLRIVKDVKKKFRILVTSLPYKSSLMKQGLGKPYGYPGDFNIIEKIYNNKPLSEGIGKYFDLIFLNNPYSQAVRGRKEKIKELLGGSINQIDSEVVNILNLGCGPCREIRELFLNDGFDTQKEIHFVLLDQDNQALQYAKSLLSCIQKNIKFDFLQADVFSFPKSLGYQSMLKKQHLIYSIGLADYLPDRILKRIIRDYFNLLVPGGEFIIAHKDREKDPHAPIFPDWFCNWHFVPRNEEYFIRLIKELNLENIFIKRSIESTGKIIFLHLKKEVNKS